MKRQAKEVYGFVPPSHLRRFGAADYARLALAIAVVTFVGVLTWPR
jgi:hypothetical protein